MKNSFAQQTAKDSTKHVPVDSTKFYSFGENNFDYGNGLVIQTLLTNNLDGLQNYHDRQLNTGNAGSAEEKLSFPALPTTAFNRGPNHFSYFGYSADNRTFYSSDKPYTKIFVVMGSKQEQQADVVHAHPLGKNCNVAFGFKRIRSTGFYQRQNTNNTSIDLNGWFRSPGRRYATLSDFYWTVTSAAENGGIANDSFFTFRTITNRQLIPVHLSAADTKIRTRGAWVKQYWSFGSVVDTLKNPADSGKVHTVIRPSVALVNTIGISDEAYMYHDKDPLSGFYETIFLDSTQTKDSTYLSRFQTGLWLEFFNVKRRGSIVGSYSPRRLFGEVGVRYENGKIKNDTIFSSFNNIFADGWLRYDFKGLQRFVTYAGAACWYVMNGTNIGDYHATFDLDRGIGNKNEILLMTEVSAVKPAYLFQHYSGNNFRWVNDFAQQSANAFYLTYKHAPLVSRNYFIISLNYFQYDHPLYFDSLSSLPAQLNGKVNAYKVELNWLTGTKHFRLHSMIDWNNVPSSSPIRLPEFVVRESVYGDFYLFHSALKMQAGVDAFWFTAFYADAYNPAIAQFYLQDRQQSGNYVFLSPWVSFKIKPVRFFIKADHVNAGFSGRNYMLVPHYPQNDFALKFGLSWVFND